MLNSFFKPVPKWSMDEAKKHFETHKPDQYNLIDVRQPEEYAEGHLPGARSMPLGELPARLNEIDRTVEALTPDAATPPDFGPAPGGPLER